MNVLVRYFRIYAALWRNSVMREMIFRANFLLWIIVDLLWFGLQLCFISVIYLHTESIGTWTQWQVVLLIGTSNFIQQVFQGVFLVNLTNLSELVRTGKLDYLLIQPVNPRFIVSFRQIDPGAFVNAAVAVAVMGVAAHHLGLRPDPAAIALFLLLCGVGVMVHYSLMLLLACASFWTVKAQGMVWGYYNLFNIARMPDEAFRGLFKAFFTLAIPMLLVSNVPARVLSAKIASPGMVLLLLGMGAGCVVVSEIGWRASLKRYASASS